MGGPRWVQTSPPSLPLSHRREHSSPSGTEYLMKTGLGAGKEVVVGSAGLRVREGSGRGPWASSHLGGFSPRIVHPPPLPWRDEKVR